MLATAELCMVALEIRWLCVVLLVPHGPIHRRASGRSVDITGYRVARFVKSGIPGVVLPNKEVLNAVVVRAWRHC